MPPITPKQWLVFFGRPMAREKITLWSAWDVTKRFKIPISFEDFRKGYMAYRRQYEIAEAARRVKKDLRIPPHLHSPYPYRMKRPYEYIVRGKYIYEGIEYPYEMAVPSWRPMSYDELADVVSERIFRGQTPEVAPKGARVIEMELEAAKYRVR